MSLWEFYKQLVEKAREADPEFPLFDHEDFVEELRGEAVRIWEGLIPFVNPSPARYEEHWEQLTPRDRYWHWFCCAVYYACYGSTSVVMPKEVFGHAKYNSHLKGVGAPVPVKDEILGGPATPIKFTDEEAARMHRAYEGSKW